MPKDDESATPVPFENNKIEVFKGPSSADPRQGKLNLGIEKQIEIDGVGMGVLSDGTPILPPSRAEFIDKYRRLCGHIAWDFVRRSHRDVSPITLTQEDAEDFASCALVKLASFPEKHIGQSYEKYYVQRTIENAITTAWRKRLRTMQLETDGTRLRVYSRECGRKGPAAYVYEGDIGTGREGDIFDRLPKADGEVMAANVLRDIDVARVASLLPSLPNAERVVVELTFGLNGAESFSRKRIAKKLGRTEWWAESKLNSALLRIREQISSQAPSLAVS